MNIITLRSVTAAADYHKFDWKEKVKIKQMMQELSSFDFPMWEEIIGSGDILTPPPPTFRPEEERWQEPLLEFVTLDEEGRFTAQNRLLKAVEEILASTSTSRIPRNSSRRKIAGMSSIFRG